ncbi:ribosome small subunit-dependent GTPase A [soil metagenome]
MQYLESRCAQTRVRGHTGAPRGIICAWTPPVSDRPDTLPPGWNEHWTAEWAEHGLPGLTPCRVVRIDKGGITVARTPGEELLVIAAKAVRRVVVGDVCGLDVEAGRIEQILPRQTVFERRSPGVSRDQLQLQSRPLAANMDRVFVLQPLETGVNLTRLARELVLAWESGAQPVVVLTKADLVDAEWAEHERSEARRFAPGVEVHVISTRGAHGLAELDHLHGPGHVIALLGASGAGKSSLVNALAGRSVQLVAEVRDNDRRGRHTTSAGQIIQLTDGALLIDTPGIRGVGLWSADEGFEKAFDDLSDFAQQCRFADCTHTNEPGCGLLEAVAAGKIGADRVEIWQALALELEQLEDGLETRDREQTKERNQRARRKAKRRDADQSEGTGRSYEQDDPDDDDDD